MIFWDRKKHIIVTNIKVSFEHVYHGFFSHNLMCMELLEIFFLNGFICLQHQ